MIAEFLADVLTGLGHEVCGVADAEDEAVLLAMDTRPDLIILDAALRAGSGLTALERISETGPVAHIVMSGDRATLATLPPHVTLAKPFSERDLVCAIERASRATYQQVA